VRALGLILGLTLGLTLGLNLGLNLGLTLAPLRLARLRQDLPIGGLRIHPRQAPRLNARVPDAVILDAITRARCCRSSMTGEWQAYQGCLCQPV